MPQSENIIINSENKRLTLELKMERCPLKLYTLPVVTRSRAPARWWDCSGLDRKFEGILWYTNASMTVFMQEGTVLATGSRFVLFLLTDQLGSSVMAARFGKLSTKKHLQKFKQPNIHKNVGWLIKLKLNGGTVKATKNTQLHGNNYGILKACRNSNYLNLTNVMVWHTQIQSDIQIRSSVSLLRKYNNHYKIIYHWALGMIAYNTLINSYLIAWIESRVVQ